MEVLEEEWEGREEAWSRAKRVLEHQATHWRKSSGGLRGATRGFLSLDTEASGAAHKESGKEKQLHQSSGTVLTSSQAIIIVTTHTLLSRRLYLSAQLYINS